MGDFKALYIKFCSKYRVQKQKSVEEALVTDGYLNLSNEALSTSTCTILGKVFEASKFISKISFDNCLLDEERLRSILLGLKSNKSITSISLKGNVIKDDTVLELANLLLVNRTLLRLSLEWNCLGLNISCFIKFCNAVECNGSLLYLDLKSNQLGPNSASYIGKAIARNSSLTFIDLSHNNIGNDGAKLILDGLKENNTLLKLSLLGNNMYDDIITEIASQLFRIEQSTYQRSQYINEAKQLKQSMKLKEEAAVRHFIFLEKELDSTKSMNADIIRESQYKIKILKEECETKNKRLLELSTELDTTSMSLKKMQEFNNELADKFESTKRELSKLKDVHDQFTKQSIEKQNAESQMYQAEKESMQNIINKYEIQCQDYESRWKSSKSTVLALKEKLIASEAESKAVKYECEEIVTKQKGEHKDLLKKLDKNHATEVKKIIANYGEKENEMKKKIVLLESQNEEFEKDLRSLKHQLASEKEDHQSYINSLKQQLKNDQKSFLCEHVDKMREVERNREEIEAKLQTQISNFSDLSSLKTRLESKIHSMTNDISSLQAEIEVNKNGIRVAELRVRSEMAPQLEELKEIKIERVALKDRIMQSEAKHNEDKKCMADSLKQLEKEVTKLNAKLNEKEREILKIKEEENIRRGRMQTALLQYMQPSAS